MPKFGLSVLRELAMRQKCTCMNECVYNVSTYACMYIYTPTYM